MVCCNLAVILNLKFSASEYLVDDFETSLNMSCSEVSFCGRIEETMDESTIESQDLSFQENDFTLNTSRLYWRMHFSS